MRLPIIFSLVLLLLHGCAAPGGITGPAPEDQEQPARAHLAAGNYTAAAEEYLLLAELNKRQTIPYLLKAADAYIQGNEFSLAQSTLDRLQDDKLTALQQMESNVLTGRIALARDDALLAINKLDFAIPADVPRYLLIDYLSTRATAFWMDRQYSRALHARVRLGQYLDGSQEIQDNNRKIWEVASALTIPELEQELAAASISPDLAGWLELAVISKSDIYDQQILETSLTAWVRRYPGHPGHGGIIQEIMDRARQASVRPDQIALLLPFSSQYRDIANAIREGFMAAWYTTPGEKPRIRLYNSDRNNIIDIYNTAINDGADFIVGPLEKEAVTTLVESGNISVTTLALNEINPDEQNKTIITPATSASALFQFGLLPEDEARQAAERAWGDGHTKALIITPDTTWGERILNAFSSRWTEMGGAIVEQVKIPAGLQDYSAPVRQLLNIDNSEQRTKQLIAALNRKIYSEPRYRRDADIVFLASTPVMARQIVPQLRYFRVNDIITYSISSIYSGYFDPVSNSDIDNVIFTDMPWLLDPEYEYDMLQQTLNRSWGQNESPYRRFYAFGADAYRIIPELGRLQARNDVYKGQTGDLKVTPEGHIRRSAAWAKFVNGSPQLLKSQ